MKILNKKAFAVLEYVVLFVIILGAFLMMKNYIQRGFFGSWAQSGQSLAFGRQYDPQRTIECSYDEQSNVWYDHNCAQAQCASGDNNCVEAAVSGCLTSSCNSASQ